MAGKKYINIIKLVKERIQLGISPEGVFLIKSQMLCNNSIYMQRSILGTVRGIHT